MYTENWMQRQRLRSFLWKLLSGAWRQRSSTSSTSVRLRETFTGRVDYFLFSPPANVHEDKTVQSCVSSRLFETWSDPTDQSLIVKRIILQVVSLIYSRLFHNVWKVFLGPRASCDVIITLFSPALFLYPVLSSYIHDQWTVVRPGVTQRNPLKRREGGITRRLPPPSRLPHLSFCSAS